MKTQQYIENREVPLPFRSDRLWLDVRTPSEYAQGHIPGAISFPLFSDEEREEVGTLYVQESREVAIRRGLEMVGPRLAEMVREAEELASDPRSPSSRRPLMLYCARGGMRSGSVEWLLKLYGFDVVRYEGGFKAFKALLPAWAPHLRIVVIEGATGSGKTEVLHELRHKGAQVIDLEGLARHRGSAFGRLPDDPQRSNETFTADLIEQLAQLDFSRPIFVESESKKIGSLQVPDPFFEVMRRGDHLEISVPYEARLARIVRVYGTLPQEYLLDAFGRISKRMGLEASTAAQKAVEEGRLQEAVALALQYYDKAYSRSSQELWGGRKLGVVSSPGGDPSLIAKEIISSFEV